MHHYLTGQKHAAQFDPTAGGKWVRCNGPKGWCWEPDENPTVEHARQAEAHYEAAAAARGEPGASRTVEDIVCFNVPAAARGVDPLDGVDVIRVEALTDASGPAAQPRLSGARLFIRSSARATELQKAIDCYTEHVSNTPGEDTALRTSPLLVPRTISRVRENDGETIVDIRAADEAQTAEVLRRARSFAGER